MGRRDQVDAERYNHYACPNCGGEVRIGSLACPHCGSDDETGWADNSHEAALDLPGGYGGDETFDYERFIREEFGEKTRARNRIRQGLRDVALWTILSLIGIALLYSVLTV